MKRFITRIGLICFAVAAAAMAGAAQEQVAMHGQAPFAAGETLRYEAKLNKILRGMHVADLTMNVRHDEQGRVVVQADALSRGTLLKLARYSFEQNFTSTIESGEFRILKTVKHDVQKERVRNSEAVFDYGEQRVTWVETDPKEPMRTPRRIASAIPEDTHDLVSGIYQLRMLPLKVGETFDLTISDSGLAYQIPIKVTAREQQNTVLGKVWCFRLEPAIFGPGRMIEQDGSMIIWITDDERRVPVRAQVNSPIGRVEIRLREMKTAADAATARR